MDMNEENKKRLKWIFEEFLYSPRMQEPRRLGREVRDLTAQLDAIDDFLKLPENESRDFPDIEKRRDELLEQGKILGDRIKGFFEINFTQLLVDRFVDYLRELS